MGFIVEVYSCFLLGGSEAGALGRGAVEQGKVRVVVGGAFGFFDIMIE